MIRYFLFFIFIFLFRLIDQGSRRTHINVSVSVTRLSIKLRTAVSGLEATRIAALYTWLQEVDIVSETKHETSREKSRMGVLMVCQRIIMRPHHEWLRGEGARICARACTGEGRSSRRCRNSTPCCWPTCRRRSWQRRRTRRWAPGWAGARRAKQAKRELTPTHL